MAWRKKEAQRNAKENQVLRFQAGRRLHVESAADRCGRTERRREKREEKK